jgi:hypothetical protein
MKGTAVHCGFPVGNVHKENSICLRPAVVAAAPCHLNNIATNIHVRAQTLLTVCEICEQLMHVTWPILTTFLSLI